MLIYAIRNRVNNKGYIGQAQHSLEQRWRQHVNDANRGSRLPIHCAIRKYGQDKFQRTVIFYAKDKPELNAAETAYILAFRTNEPTRGYNLTLGGDGRVGSKASEETRQRMSKARRGKKHSEDTRRKISEAKRNISEATRRKLSDAKRGRPGKPLPEDTRRKISEAKKGKKLGPQSAETRLIIATIKRTKPGMLCPAPWLPRGAKF